jgi:hypothetical protein
MESSISHEQRIVRTNHNVLWNEQLTSHMLSNDDNDIQRNDTGWVTSQLHGQFCDTWRNKTTTAGTYNQVPQNCG